MKTIYGVQMNFKTESKELFTSENENEAREFFKLENLEKKCLICSKPADTTGWQDEDRAWGYVYNVELYKLTFDEDDEIEDMDTLELTDYYWCD